MNSIIVKILFIEDDRSFADIIRKIFKKEAPRYQIECAERLSSGLDRLSSGGIDLVLLDLGLSDSQGLATLQKVVTGFPDIPIIIVTGSEEKGLWSKAIRYGAQDLLIKGNMDGDALLQSIFLTLERQHLLSAHQQKVEELAASRGRLRLLIEKNADGMIIIDMQGIIRFVNPAACALWGSEPDEMIGTAFGFPVAVGNSAEIDIVRFGETIVAEMRPVTITWEGEESLLVSIRDISQRKMLEEQVRIQHAFLDKLLETSPEGIAILDTQFRIQRINSQFTVLFGYTSESAEGQLIKDLIVPAHLSKESEQIHDEMLKGQIVQAETVRRHKDGSLMDVSLLATAIPGDLGVEGIYNIYRDITERKRSEEALRHSQQMLAFHIKQTPLAFIQCDTDLKVMDWNPAAEKIFGYRKGEVLGKQILDKLIPIDQRQQVYDFFTKSILPSMEGIKTKNENITKEGNTIICEWYDTPILDEQNQIVGVACLIQDITENIKNQDKVFQQSKLLLAVNQILTRAVVSPNEEKVARACLSAAEGLTSSQFSWIGEFNQNGNLGTIALSEEALRLCGITCEQALALLKNMKTRNFWGEVLECGKSVIINDPADHTKRIELPEYHSNITSFLGVPLKSGGRVTGLIALANKEGGYSETDQEDIEVLAFVLTEAIERIRAEKAVVDNQKRLELILETTPAGIMIVDTKSHNIIDLNPYALKLIGGERERTIGKSCLGFICPHERCPVTDLGKKIENEESILLKSDGSELPILKTAVPFYLHGRQVILETFIDLTERKEMETKLRQTDRLESIGQLAAGIAHEINTPTHFVRSNVEFLQNNLSKSNQFTDKAWRLLQTIESRAPIEGAVQEMKTVAQGLDLEYLSSETAGAIEDCLSGLDRIGKIVDSMRYFAHPGKEERTPVYLNQAIENAVTVSRNEWKYCADLTTDLDPEMPSVYCISSHINQVLLNLIINAAHAIAEKLGENPEEKGKIAITTSRKGDWVEICISDTGTGVPEKIRNRIFDPFFTTKEVGRGTGQGLAIARAIIVKEHMGTIHFKTEVGQGTIFIVRLPMGSPEN